MPGVAPSVVGAGPVGLLAACELARRSDGDVGAAGGRDGDDMTADGRMLAGAGD
jgi:2-polyprenyl-6-methoxyphenol hydroxylase-like FAD-dependent oxidoreductase